MTLREDVRFVNSRRFMRRIFRNLVRRNYPPGAELLNLKTKEVGPFRFKRALRYDLRLRTPQGKSVDVVVRGNVPSKDTRNEIVVADLVQRALSRRGFSFGTYRAPASFGVIPKLRLNLYEDVPGVTLESLVRRRDPSSLRVARRAGAWLSAFHRLRLQVGPRRTKERVKNEVGFFRDDVTRFDSGMIGRMVCVLAAAENAQREIFRSYRRFFRTIHGDLNLGNIIAAPNQDVAFIDYGGSWIFDPLSDVGNFLAQVDLTVWRGFVSRKFADQLVSAFLRGYPRHPTSIGPNIQRRIDLHRAWWTLQIIAYIVSTKHRMGKRIAPRALERAERLLAERGYATARALDRVDGEEFRRALRNSTTMFAYFAERLRAFFPSSQKIDKLSVEHPRALSGTSYLMRYVLQLRMPGGSVRERVVRGNFLDPETFKILVRAHTARSRGFRTMRPLRYESRFRYVFYEELAGDSLRAVDPESPTFSRLLPNIAAALVAFHRVPRRDLRGLSLRNEVRFMKGLLRRIRASAEGRRLDLRRIERTVLRAEQQHWKRFRGVVHNDFQASNVLRTPRGIGIIDFTLSGVGNRALDVANFLMHLRVMLDRVVSQRRIESNASSFLRSYERRLSSPERTRLRASFPAFQLRSALDIFATTIRNLDPRDPNRRRYTQLLDNVMRGVLKEIQRP